jgi:hypothetical protein
MTRRPSKAQRRAALAEFLADAPPLPEIPEVDAPVEIDTRVIVEDGKLLTGSTWVTPGDFAEAEVADGSLPSVKGATPEELPTLGDDQGG